MYQDIRIRNRTEDRPRYGTGRRAGDTGRNVNRFTPGVLLLCLRDDVCVRHVRVYLCADVCLRCVCVCLACEWSVVRICVCALIFTKGAAARKKRQARHALTRARERKEKTKNKTRIRTRRTKTTRK